MALISDWQIFCYNSHTPDKNLHLLSIDEVKIILYH